MLLEGVRADPGRRIGSVEMTGERDRNEMVHVWNRTQASSPPAETIDAVLAEHAARTPDAVAVQCGGETLTYRQLDARANRLAQYPVRRRGGPEGPGGRCPGPGLGVVITRAGD